jgi:electron transfer flavoprotein alpha subunit
MSVLVFIETTNGTIKKSGLEAMYYGSQIAQLKNTACHAVIFGNSDKANILGKYGAKSVFYIDYAKGFDSEIYTEGVLAAASATDAEIIVIAHTFNGKSFAGRVAAMWNAGIVTSVNSLPKFDGGLTITKSVFSGKATAHYKIKTAKAVLTLAGNSIQIQESGSEVTPQKLDWSPVEPKIKVLERKTSEGLIPLPEAELVVSAGRGMKGPENWGIVEELAKALQATTACSRPVADTGWRPHHEHVGQTGVAIKPNLYIAIGISGAIQHLAGVNNSKTIVVINKDPEAPFFKAADYGVVGDLFEVVPKLTEAVKKFKSNQ